VQQKAPQRPVLVADDEEQLLQLCGRVLGRRGYEVLAARRGDDAVRVFAACDAEVRAVVIDATIPPDGAASAVQQMLKLRGGLRVVFTSGGDLDDSQRALLFDHAGVFLRKPFPAEALVRAVEDAAAPGDA
jgi:two-component system cell cycle sensor histidine kinase/response regulator CckA